MEYFPKFFFGFCIIFITFFIFWISLYSEEEYIEESFMSTEFVVKESGTKYILLYEYPAWMATVFLENTSNRCIITQQRDFFPRLEMFDALIFSAQNTWKSKAETFPPTRYVHQQYIFVDLECPLMSYHKFSRDPRKEIYNLTMTYRRDSDIYWPYGFISDKNISYQSNAEEQNWRNPDFSNITTPELIESVNKKTKTAAWFVSNCYPHSKRDVLTKVIQKIVDVDIYGKCGSMRCPRETTEKCYEHVEQQYFFYLSLENSLCNDYITEKVFNIMKYNVVPIVYGGANYSQHLPPYSYIDANAFETATELGKYLKYLRENVEEYIKFFWWKKYYTTIVSVKLYNNLCDKLHILKPDLENKSTKSHSDIKKWWTEHQCTMTPKIKLI